MIGVWGSSSFASIALYPVDTANEAVPAIPGLVVQASDYPPDPFEKYDTGLNAIRFLPQDTASFPTDRFHLHMETPPYFSAGLALSVY